VASFMVYSLIHLSEIYDLSLSYLWGLWSHGGLSTKLGFPGSAFHILAVLALLNSDRLDFG